VSRGDDYRYPWVADLIGESGRTSIL
jgi:hypothetical protein